jgi:Tfp pilus assembly PilM family ATPase
MPESGTGSAAALLKKQLDLDPDEIDYLVHDGGFGEPGDRRGAEAFSDARRVLASHFAPLAHELRLTFSYTEHQYPQAPVKSLLLVGGGAGIPGVAEHLHTALDMEVRVARPTDVVTCAPAVMERATPAIMAALGLAQFTE